MNTTDPKLAAPDTGVGCGDLFGVRAETWPRDGHRFICEPNYPMPRPQPHGTSWIHPLAVDAGRNDPYYDHYKCPLCGTHFSCEVAE